MSKLVWLFGGIATTLTPLLSLMAVSGETAVHELVADSAESTASGSTSPPFILSS